MLPHVRPLRWASVIAATLITCCTAGAADWYVAPGGQSQNAGTRQAPWDIESTLAGGRGVKAGDTVYLLGGTYRRRPKEQYEVKLVGEEGRSVRVRAAPGERATIDGGLLVNEPSRYLWISDLEILVSEPNPQNPVGPGSHPADFTRPWGGLSVNGGRHNKYINLVIHDCRQGVSWWVGDTDSELHGCLIYDNGWPATDRGHGHAIYTQNNDGTKTISDNIMTGGFAYTLHAYGSSRAYVNRYLVEGNVCYRAGPLLVGGGRPSEGIRVVGNHLFGAGMQIGYDAPHNEDCVVRDNVVVNGAINVKNFRRVENEANTVLSDRDPRPAGALVVLRPNKYDARRANLVVYNWERKPTVAVDLSKFLKPGERFRLMSPRDFYGKPAVSGEYGGSAIELPIDGEFAAFVVLRDAAGAKD
jgi:hypothetical protein